MAVTPLPFLDRTAATFKTDVDAFFAQKLPQFSVDVNQVAAAVDASAAAANTSKNAAATSATNASTSATNASTFATNANNSAIAANTSKTNAATSETNAANSATAASNSKTAAATSATNAANSATRAETAAAGIASGPVTSVNSKTGIVTLAAADVGALPAAANAVSASKLATPRIIQMGGDLTGQVTFDGSGNVTIPVVVLDDSHNHVITNVDGLQAALDSTSSLMGKNFIINGNFDIWQRGGSQSVTGYGSADRWSMGHFGGTKTASLQRFPVDTGVPFARIFCRHVVAGGSAANNYTIMSQAIEDLSRFTAGAYTLSFWAKADAAKSISVELAQSFGTGGSPSATVFGIGATKLNLTTGWAKYTVPFTMPTYAGKTVGTNGDSTLLLNFWFSAGSDNSARSAALGVQSGTFDISQVQLEEGSNPTPFELQDFAQTTLQCHRYYQTGSINFYSYSQPGVANSYTFKMPVQMRTTPTMTWGQTSGSNIASSGIAALDAQSIQPSCTVTSSGGYGLTGNYTCNAEF